MIFTSAWLAVALAATAVRADGLISPGQANRHGLVRAWFAVVDIDPRRGQLISVLVTDDSLFALTSRGIVQALDARTGANRWVKRIGNPNYPSLGPSANAEFVAIVNGSTLYVLDRQTGETLWEQRLGGGPGAGPGLSTEMIYVPLISGAIEGFSLVDTKQPRWVYQSVGRALVQPVTTTSSLFWPTDRGYLYVGRSNDPGVRFRIETEDEITARPAFLEPLVFAVSLDGYVYAANETLGSQRWRYSLGDPISEAPAAMRDLLFVCSERPRMVCFTASDGEVRWDAPRVARFVAASEDRVYGADRYHRLHVLDQKTGTRLGVLDTTEASVAIVNQQTDRIYLATPTGLIQCLHEQGRTEPLMHSKAVPEDPAGGTGEAPDAADDAPNPFGDEEEEEENPFE